MAYLSLDLQYFAGEKTEKATPKKREESRKKGQVAKSSDINTAISLFFMFLFLTFGTSYMGNRLESIMRKTFQNSILMPVDPESIAQFFYSLTLDVVKIMIPVLIVGLFASIVPNVMQVGFMFSAEAIQLKLDRLDPLKGFKRIYSLRAIVELLKSILKISSVGLIVFIVLWMHKDQVMTLPEKPLSDSLIVIGKITSQLGLSVSVFLIFLGILDYLYQRFDFEKNIRMSKQDIKDEYKKTEGDPQIKSRIKEKQRQMAMQRMMQEVPKADVVITNPTHFAVALLYDDTKMDAPVVVAKGADYVALKIREIAKKNRVVTIEKRPLARALYHQLEIGDPIPEEFFKAVAEILAYVYRLKKKI